MVLVAYLPNFLNDTRPIESCGWKIGGWTIERLGKSNNLTISLSIITRVLDPISLIDFVEVRTDLSLFLIS